MNKLQILPALVAVSLVSTLPLGEVKVYEFADQTFEVRRITDLPRDMLDDQVRFEQGITTYEVTVLDGGSPQELARFLIAISS